MSQPSRRRRLNVEDIGDITAVNFVDNRILDELNITAIKEQLLSLVAEDGRRKILLNFFNIEYLSSAALGPLIALRKSLDNCGGKLVICNIDPELLKQFVIARLDNYFTIRNTEMDAIAELR